MRVLTMSVAVVAAGFAVANTVEAKTTLKMISSLATNTTNGMSMVQNWLEPINNDKNAEVGINFLGGPEVQPPNRAHGALQRGIVDILYGPAGYYGGQVPEAFTLLATRHPVSTLWESGAFDLLQPVWAKKLNARIIAWGESNMPMHVYTQFEPQMTAMGASLAGKKIRTSPTYRKFLEELEATPVSMPAGDIYTGLQRGVIDGFCWTNGGVPALGLAGIVKYRVDPGFYRSNSLVIINLDAWKKLSKVEKDYLEKMARRYEKASEAMMLREMQAEEKQLLAEGMKIVTLKGAAAEAYLKTAYDSQWARIDDLLKGNTKALRAKFYSEE